MGLPRTGRKLNCWEITRCGRQPGGPRSATDPCPTATEGSYAGLNGGLLGGRICWAIAGTFCDGPMRGSCARKPQSCASCSVFHTVQEEEGPAFRLLVPEHDSQHLLFEQFVGMLSILESMSLVVYVADLVTHEMLYLNPEGERVFGRHGVGKRCFEVIHPGRTEPCPWCTNERLVEGGRPAAPQVHERRMETTGRWYQCVDRAIRWWDGRLVRMQVALDITERKQAEEFHEQYVGIIGHDLRNPLNAILLETQVLRAALKRRGLEEEVTLAGRVIASSERMNGLIADLLETTHLESAPIELHRRTIDLLPWLAEVAVRVAPPAQRHRVVIDPLATSVSVSVDTDRLARVVENLVSNALKYSGDAPVEVTVGAEGAEAVVAVRDHGVGIARAEVPSLFQRFYRATSAGRVKGLGLGLYSARLLVEAHGGRIWAESDLGQGAVFRFALPRSPSPPSPSD